MRPPIQRNVLDRLCSAVDQAKKTGEMTIEHVDTTKNRKIMQIRGKGGTLFEGDFGGWVEPTYSMVESYAWGRYER